MRSPPNKDFWYTIKKVHSKESYIWKVDCTLPYSSNCSAIYFTLQFKL